MYTRDRILHALANFSELTKTTVRRIAVFRACDYRAACIVRFKWWPSQCVLIRFRERRHDRNFRVLDSFTPNSLSINRENYFLFQIRQRLWPHGKCRTWGCIWEDADAVAEDPVRAKQNRLEGRFHRLATLFPLTLWVVNREIAVGMTRVAIAKS